MSVEEAQAIWPLALLLGAGVVLVIGMCAYTLLRASEHPAPTLLTVTLTMLTLVSLAAFCVIRAVELLTLSTALAGALTGALSMAFDTRSHPERPPEPPTITRDPEDG